MNSLQWRSIKSLALERDVPVEKILEMASSGEPTLSLHLDGDLSLHFDGDRSPLTLPKDDLQTREQNLKQIAARLGLQYSRSDIDAKGVIHSIEKLKRHGRLVDILPEDVIRFVGGASTELFRCCIRGKDGSNHLYRITDREGKIPKFSLHDIVLRVHTGSAQVDGGIPGCEGLAPETIPEASLTGQTADSIPPDPAIKGGLVHGKQDICKIYGVKPPSFDNTVAVKAKKYGITIHRQEGSHGPPSMYRDAIIFLKGTKGQHKPQK